ncbi:hypothetical protein SALBM311S_12734 [Streptomyces alboniger]
MGGLRRMVRRPHPAIRMFGPDLDGYPYSWDGLELFVTQRQVSGIWDKPLARLDSQAAVACPPGC